MALVRLGLGWCSSGLPYPVLSHAVQFPSASTCLPACPLAGGVQLSGQLRLSGGPSPAEGLVQAQLRSGEWTGLCQAGADSAATAEVVCRQLGLGGPAAPRLGMYAGSGLDALGNLTEVLHCAGSEEGLGDCFLAPEATSACAQAGALGVACGGEAVAPGRGERKDGHGGPKPAVFW